MISQNNNSKNIDNYFPSLTKTILTSCSPDHHEILQKHPLFSEKIRPELDTTLTESLSYHSESQETSISDISEDTLRSFSPDNFLKNSTFFSRKFNKKNLQEKKSDLTAQLICQINSEDKWTFRLSNFSGENVAYLLGCAPQKINEIKELPLDAFIPEDKKEFYHQCAASILNEASNSPYWNLLFDNMMSGTTKIESPYDKTPRFVDISMSLNDSVSNATYYIFTVTMTDQTALYDVANKAGSLTHDARAYVQSARDITQQLQISEKASELSETEFMRLSPEEMRTWFKLNEINKKNREDQYQNLNLLLTDIKSMFGASRVDFLPQTVRNKKVKEFIQEKESLSKESFSIVDQELKEYIKELTRTQSFIHNSSVKLSLLSSSDSQLSEKKMRIFKRFLLNLIKNAVEASATKINIHCFSIVIDEMHHMLNCIITDNGLGMSPEYRQSFFERKIPNKVITNIDANRGEGTLMAYSKWQGIGGTAVCSAREDNKRGTTFKLATVPSPSRLFPSLTTNLLNQEQITILTALKANASKGIILLVDDSLLILKISSKKIANIFPNKREFTALNNINSNSWQKMGLTVDIIDEWGIVCAANADVAYEIIKKYPVTMTITDQQMPGTKQGADLISNSREV